ncbi:glycerol-3-phosphate dehydrogenase/oxidase [Paenibacillus sp. J22TS3]|uniref:glycerol-3-phosphate dehydrogenase/oxidase n=1 Tax=Paenibacillus sp. J22TS3 TaxID=2807192 RepID=UPI001B2B2827|nr:glycerol-3-phosphate dehydrogenase/oxidase [Paenibacillus sp. J22TS3]GIP22336.1 glycerol-3-phosphate dehydrogenase [Paenibacillus sp. J22TS3]
MTTAFSSKRREMTLQDMVNGTLDVLVIGGGITGSGIALDAASRGMNVGLVEMQDYAAGTSSRSTKLVHGGLRYLKQLEVGVVAEVGKERAIVYENGPHVTTPEWMLLPFHKGGTFGKFTTSMGLRVYDFLAGVKRSERRKMLSVSETLSKEPLIKKKDLKGGGYYVEYRTDDARLTIEVLKEAVSKGALAVNYAKVTEFIYDKDIVAGVVITDLLSGRTYEVRARKIVNAAGPWVDTLREMDHSKIGKTLQLTKGIHLVIDQKRFPLRQAIYFDTPDGRMVFAIPRDGKTYVGTTDTVYKADTSHPRMTVADRKYVMDAINYMFPEVQITEKDIESSWAGVRPLIHEEGKDPSEISRKDEIWQSDSGLITIAGGKLTGYRKMAETVVDKVASQLQAEGHSAFPACSTKHMPISGGHVGGSDKFKTFVAEKVEQGMNQGLTRELAAKWTSSYGSNVDRLYEIAAECAAEAAAGPLPLEVLVPLRYAMEEEMTVKPADFFIRRTGALFFNIQWVRTWKQHVVNYMAESLGWSPEQKMSYASELEMYLHDAVVPEDAENLRSSKAREPQKIS